MSSGTNFNGPVTAGTITTGDHNGTTYYGSSPVEPSSSYGDYEPVEPDGEEFDVAFSFAQPDRDYVERTRVACGRLGIRVMYDLDHSNEWWGQNFIAEQRKIYGARSRFFVPFISRAYFARTVPPDEFAAAMWADIERGGGYILPVLIGAVQVAPHLLPRHIGFLRAERYTPDRLAAEIHRKVTRGITADQPLDRH